MKIMETQKAQNLYIRSITAAIMIIPMLGLIFFAPSSWVVATLIFLLIICGFEWIKLIPLTSIHACWFIPVLLISFRQSMFFLNFYQIVGFFCLWALFIALLFFPKSQNYWGKKTIVALCCLILLPLCFATLLNIYQHKHGSAYLLYLLLLVWATDTGGYILGQRFGAHKLIPTVSPGKTIEGSIGGIFAAICVGIIGWFYFHPKSFTLWCLQLIGTVLLAMVGDLAISMFKRRVKCKDTGYILPGHGGILDRLDSLISAAPVFYVLLFC